ncbi:MAG: TIGR04084 family radical SAM/SPASM domain-containing protein [Methanocorpusculum sp.]|uniref:TIGR04084 family radical SAM/SPASM domain-containing protein n=1 Tax=Methanocorpusculum sp. TaxID=2058474 RepID=UPI00271E9A5C|nr:TIGR04084 family radical SAM/SPASM domain-containing protein [Methanocorpusculum sp.]MDO9523186.1 TIGR04084 family radical SAM/SPASM domain-containing protein [Methanocorpusculum sp.]
MFFHLIVTDDCNLCCSYCRGKMFEEEDLCGNSPGTIDETICEDLAYPLRDLYAFLSKDPHAVLTFIGGEPLIRSDLVMEIMDHAPVKRFMLQTNGTLLGKLPKEYTNQFETILISIDGERALTDGHRGKGMYDLVLGTVDMIRSNGFTGELIARMTVAEDTEIFSAVTHLAEHFSSIHWQMDADFTGDFSRRRFAEWSEGYNAGIRRLVAEWVSRIETTGVVPKWYPFLSTTEDLLLGRPSKLRCGSGYVNYSVMTNGQIAPCPIMVGMADFYAGEIRTADPLSLPEIPVREPCLSCDIYGFCGGRCLYSNIVRPWRDGYRLVCGTVRNLHDALVENLPRIRTMLDDGSLPAGAFAHTRYNGCEIIP